MIVFDMLDLLVHVVLLMVIVAAPLVLGVLAFDVTVGPSARAARARRARAARAGAEHAAGDVPRVPQRDRVKEPAA